VKTINDIMYYPTLAESVGNVHDKKTDPAKAAKQVEVVFLNELLKNMLENTDFGKDKMVSDYMPYITTEISKSLSERGIGIHDFLMRSPSFRDMVTESGSAKDTGSKMLKPEKPAGGLQMPLRGVIPSGYGSGLGK
jgi:Rod binding domain-containing protein